MRYLLMLLGLLNPYSHSGSAKTGSGTRYKLSDRSKGKTQASHNLTNGVTADSDSLLKENKEGVTVRNK